MFLSVYQFRMFTQAFSLSNDLCDQLVLLIV